jgi:hypothetical protein
VAITIIIVAVAVTTHVVANLKSNSNSYLSLERGEFVCQKIEVVDVVLVMTAFGLSLFLF